MKLRFGDLDWHYWAATVVLLAIGVAGKAIAFKLAIALSLVQVVHFAIRERSLTAFPVQLRVAYTLVLLVGQWESLAWIYWVPLVGTTVLLFDYCFLGRTLALLPWNRRVPLSRKILARTYLVPPVEGSILDSPWLRRQ